MNKVILMGRLTADPELRQTQSGISTCKFTVAINRRVAGDGQQAADFISCTAWRQTAEFVSKYFRKGNMICLDGSIRTGSYTDRNHPDVTHYTTDIMVDNVEFTGSKRETQGEAAPAAQTTANNPTITVTTDTELSQFQELLNDPEVPF